MKFVLLHESKNDEGIRAFFTDVWELYVKVSQSDVRISG
jgi:trafficking protein particle complex subunit 2